MPFASIEKPNLGVSLLKSTLDAQNIPAKVFYFNILFAELIGTKFYYLLSNESDLSDEDAIPNTALAGEWVFSQCFYGNGSLDADEYLFEVLSKPPYSLSKKAVANLSLVRTVTEKFIDRCYKSVRWDKYDIVGFTTTFEQNMASLCLARKIKQVYGNIKIAFGGANCEGVMGYELLKQFEFIDFVCTGEGDKTFPCLVKAIDKNLHLADIPGIAWRNKQNVCIDNGPSEVITDLNTSNFPDFEDYFEHFNASTLSKEASSWLLIESSRGCWWGAKSHCTFCGLNGRTMVFRSKSEARVLEEINHLVEKYKIRDLSFVDNILDLHFFDYLIPELANRKEPLRIFFETKSNLKKEQIKALARAGIRDVQPGIESLSTQVLRIMGKGVTALQNANFLKYAKQYGVNPLWNLLYGFPYEEQSEYEKQLDILKRITHLTPPSVICPIRLDRFSPNYTNASKLGLTNVRPKYTYRHIYPFSEEIISNICYFFDFDYIDDREPNEYIVDLVIFWKQWIKETSTGELLFEELQNGEGKILDTRFNRVVPSVVLDKYQTVIYKFCDSPKSVPSITKHLSEVFPERPFDESKIISFLNYMYDNYFMITESNLHLSVAISVNES